MIGSWKNTQGTKAVTIRTKEEKSQAGQEENKQAKIIASFLVFSPHSFSSVSTFPSSGVCWINVELSLSQKLAATIATIDLLRSHAIQPTVSFPLPIGPRQPFHVLCFFLSRSFFSKYPPDPSPVCLHRRSVVKPSYCILSEILRRTSAPSRSRSAKCSPRIREPLSLGRHLILRLDMTPQVFGQEKVMSTLRSVPNVGGCTFQIPYGRGLLRLSHSSRL